MCANYRVGLRLEELLERFGIPAEQAELFGDAVLRPTDPVPGIVLSGSSSQGAGNWSGNGQQASGSSLGNTEQGTGSSSGNGQQASGSSSEKPEQGTASSSGNAQQAADSGSAQSPDGGYELKVLRWGLIPYWADDIKIGIRMFNARCETLLEKRAFKESFAHRRCILPIEEFYEYDDLFRYRVSRRDGKMLGVAGLWDRNRHFREPIESCTMVTCDPNPLIATVHDRMPAILREADYERWLAPTDRPEELLDLLSAFPAEDLTMAEDGERKSAKKKPTTASLFD